MKLAWDVSQRQIIVESDSAVVVFLLRSETVQCSYPVRLLYDIKKLLARDWIVFVQHIDRVSDRSGDWLAHLGHSLPLGGHYFENPGLSERKINKKINKKSPL